MFLSLFEVVVDIVEVEDVVVVLSDPVVFVLFERVRFAIVGEKSAGLRKRMGNAFCHNICLVEVTGNAKTRMAAEETSFVFQDDTVQGFLGLTRGEIMGVPCGNVFIMEGAESNSPNFGKKSYCQHVPFRFSNKKEAYAKLNNGCDQVAELGKTWITTMSQITARVYVTGVDIELTSTSSGGMMKLTIDVLLSSVPLPSFQRRRGRVIF